MRHITLALVLLLAACGGGGDEEEDPTKPTERVTNPYPQKPRDSSTQPVNCAASAACI